MNEQPPPDSAPDLRGFGIILLLHAVAGVVVCIILLKIVPGWAKLFEDFGADLPQATRAIIRLSRITAAYWYLLLPALAALDTGILLRLTYVPPRIRWFRTYWNVGVLVGVALFYGLVTVSLLVPFYSLFNALR